MSKYSADQLSDMAAHALQAKADGDERYHSLILTVSFLTGLDAREVERQIDNFSTK